MEADTTQPIEAEAAPSVAEAAAQAIAGSLARVQVTVAGGPGAILPATHFPRLSLERRVLGHVTDEVDETEFGPRNTLAALTRALMTDRNTTNPATPEHGRLDVERPVVDVAQSVLDVLAALQAAGLVSQREDGSYAVTDAGRVELSS